ncbi:FeoB-associated Cys-rich membrane protein [Macrococcoides goetzii]|uniref:FeoB-associated Cys-rich membrane protein n=1 Tax=Macrococcoides goetzii TaxID=1891097 RepID=A0A364JM81_9STAP|nr:MULTISPECIES: FeoB-associated Cys-rich membrane protein [Macrococcus]MCH4986090.1 FeoB-associated Cys-rich membrane protein [Macrococcus sp. PK]RAI80049.1 FeoB-associated Cys-rich membrane protein [Macrococcus goetzii]UTH15762.1 FeoB-associated Cys-rich membrane protein [Macrococcus epidermidis]
MSILINVLLFVLIFGYATYTLYKFFKKSKAGKCNSCDLNDSCGCDNLHQINFDNVKK